MQGLIDVGIKQGTVLAFADNVKESDPIVRCIKEGRFGVNSNAGVAPSHLLIVLSQECGICARDTIEIVQGKEEKKFDVIKKVHLIDAQDYSKLVVKVDDKFYGFRESQLSKVSQDVFLKAIQEKKLILHSDVSPSTKRKLLNWRTYEYVREPFPDKFNKGLKSYLSGSGGWFSHFLTTKQDMIDSVRIYISPSDQENSEYYRVCISALLTEACGDSMMEAIEEQFQRMLSQLTTIFPFIISLQDENYEGEMVDLDGFSLSYTHKYDEFTFQNAYVLREYNFQYLCY